MHGLLVLQVRHARIIVLPTLHPRASLLLHSKPMAASTLTAHCLLRSKPSLIVLQQL